MANTNNLKMRWKNDLGRAIGEQDVLKLRSRLRQIRDRQNEKFRNYEMIEKKEKKYTFF
ncbi:hypothetical protein [Gaoshiqia sp. Z1-71]|uniref:hypothetical protein n=1 Tax=Gaoshiqia hydrogeniformans TaxID=3290090 RepID=UPI003BF8BE4F